MTMYNTKWDLIQTIETEIAEQEQEIERLDYSYCQEEEAYTSHENNIKKLKALITHITNVMED